MSWFEFLLLAIASAFWPLLIAIVLLALRTEHPVRLLTGFLAGGLLTTITIGCAIVFSLESKSFVSGHRPAADPVVYLTAGVLSIAAAYVVRGMQARPRAAKPKRKRASVWTERAVTNIRLAFVAGIVLDIVPGVFPFVALKNIAQTSVGAPTKVALVVVFYVIMFAFVELPIVGYVVAPARTEAAFGRFNDWLDRNARRVGVWALALVGVYLVVRGLVAAL